MFLRTKLTVAGLMLGLSICGVALAQQPKISPDAVAPKANQLTPIQNAMRRSPILRVLRQLELTDAQKQQMRVIFRTTFLATKSDRQELRPLMRQWREGTLTPEGAARANGLHKQLNEAGKSMRTQLAGILTPEQKTKLEEIIKTRKANHGLFRPRD